MTTRSRSPAQMLAIAGNLQKACQRADFHLQNAHDSSDWTVVSSELESARSEIVLMLEVKAELSAITEPLPVVAQVLEQYEHLVTRGRTIAQQLNQMENTRICPDCQQSVTPPHHCETCDYFVPAECARCKLNFYPSSSSNLPEVYCADCEEQPSASRI